MDNCKTIKEALDTTGKYTGLTKGTSMEPLIHHQRDNIIVIKNKERLKKYDVPVYLNSNGDYVMHRVVKVCDDHYVIVGDNLLQREYVTDDMICGVLVGFYKDGKKYIDCQSSRLYKLYSRLWVALLPVRPAMFFIRRCYRWPINHIFKRGARS